MIRGTKLQMQQIDVEEREALRGCGILPQRTAFECTVYDRFQEFSSDFHRRFFLVEDHERAAPLPGTARK
jgi:hypothetical protein